MNIRIVSANGRALMIEWKDEDGIHRGIIPEELVVNNEVNDEILTTAISYGIDWASVLEGVLENMTPKKFADALYGHGFWTLQDLRHDPDGVMGVIQSVYGLDFQTLLAVAERQELHGGK